MSEYDDDFDTSNGIGSSRNNAMVIDVESKISKEYGKEQRIKEYRNEANRLVSLANKRIRRLEKNGLQSSPAYQAYLVNGGKPFSTKGKDYNQLQSEVARLKRFIDSEIFFLDTLIQHILYSALACVESDTVFLFFNLW